MPMKIIRSLYDCSKCMSLPVIIQIYKSQTRPKNGVLLPLLAFSCVVLNCLLIVQNCLPRFIAGKLIFALQPFSKRWDVENPLSLYLYFCGTYSDKFHPQFHPVRLDPACHVNKDDLFSFTSNSIRKMEVQHGKTSSRGLFLYGIDSWQDVFPPNDYHFDLFKSRVNPYFMNCASSFSLRSSIVIQ